MKTPCIVYDFDETLYASHGSRRLYREVWEVLTKLRHRGYHHILLTAEQDLGFQLAKIERSRVDKLFDPRSIFIVPNPTDKHEELVRIRRELRRVARDSVDLRKSVVVGDRLDCEIRYGNSLGFTTVRICRRGGKYSLRRAVSESEVPTCTISTLKGLLTICP